MRSRPVFDRFDDDRAARGLLRSTQSGNPEKGECYHPHPNREVKRTAIGREHSRQDRRPTLSGQTRHQLPGARTPAAKKRRGLEDLDGRPVILALASLWSVADTSTGELMTGFYGYLKSGSTKDGRGGPPNST